MKRETLDQIITDLQAGQDPRLSIADFPSFASVDNSANIDEAALARISAALTADDIPTFVRAREAIDEGDLAWLGFKVVYDGPKALENHDNEVTKKYGDVGSADSQDMVFFCNDAKEIVSARTPSPRDVFQMKDATRGPSMHNDQFEGLTWTSTPLFDKVRVWLLGASDVAVELAKLLENTGFQVKVVDYDGASVSEDRFPHSERILLHGGNFSELSNMVASPEDYVCVLTRGHMFDPEGCIWALENDVHYVGMMGCAGKNDTVHDLVIQAGITEEDWERVKRPIGLNFGAKTPAELAIAIAAELIDVRYRERYSPEARERHERSLGR